MSGARPSWQRAYSAVRRHPAAAALVLSLLLHVGLAVWLSRLDPAPPRPTPPAPGEIVVVDFIDVAKPASPATPTPPAPAPAPAPKAEVQPPSRARSPRPMPPQVAAKPGSTEPAPAPEASEAQLNAPAQSAAAAPSASSGVADAAQATPRLRTLVPSGDLFAGRGGFPVAPPTQSGRTIVNDGTNRGPSSEELAGEAKARLDGWNRELLAEHRVRSGAIDSYFYDLKRSLDEKVEFDLPFDPQVQKLINESFKGYRDSLAQYGATGNPGQASHDGDLATIADDPNPEAMNRARAGAVEQTAQLRKRLQDAYGRKPVAIVEIRQTADGKFLEARLLQSSGNGAFDAHVMALVPTGIATVREVPDHVQASHPNGLRTIWEFKGEYVLHKKAKDVRVENPGDALYLAAMGATSLLSGMPFDETTGDVYVLDLKDPKFDVDVTLLQVY